jgi:imidazolonepropionase-like amidohydrolase
MQRSATPDQSNLHLRGVVLPEGAERDLYVVAGRFTFERPASFETLLTGGFLTPGLADAHAHLALASPAPPDATPEQRVRASARAQLAAGVLAIREPGSVDEASMDVGPAEGLPRVTTGGRLLAPRGAYFPGIGLDVEEDELPDAIEREARKGGGWAKVVGDFVYPDGTMRLNYGQAALTAAAQRAHAAGARIAVHATITETITACIAAGFDSIEHGVGLTDAQIADMRARDIALVPTLDILPQLPDLLLDWQLTPGVHATMLAAVERHPEMTRRAAAAGVRVYAGTDAGMLPHGQIRTEIACLAAAGLSREAALAAGSWAARAFMGLPGIEEGASADLVAYAADPRADLTALDQPALMILDGRLLPTPAVV